MTLHKDQLYHLGGVPVGSATGSIGLAGGNVYFVDVANGTAGGNALKPKDAVNSVATAYGYCKDGNNDTVVLIASGSAWAPTETLTWAKSYTHLVCGGIILPGMGARARIEAAASVDITPVLTVSGSGCLFAGIKINNMHDAAADSGCVLVSGSRNKFLNCELWGMGSTTAGARAGSWSVSVTGSENNFERCEIGCDTVLRAAANYELKISGERNSLIDCTLRSNSSTAGKFLVQIDNSGGDLRSTIFENTLFYNYSTNHVDQLTDAIDMPASGSTHDVILRGNCVFVGCDGLADTATYLFGAGPAAAAGMFLATNPTG
jgi:hypothetical protein